MTIIDRTTLLLTDARIIAENETHAVIALRVPKKWIGSNLPFFSALADVVATISQRAKV